MSLSIKGIYLAAEQWGSLLYGHSQEDSAIEMILDSFSTSKVVINVFYEAENIIKKNGDDHANKLKHMLKCLLKIDNENLEHNLGSSILIQLC
ncbi:unnamed protein product [Adineta steineri]|uniref:Uncharacterized protein n=1 Tax=Adineta steineri TaxID=433720 RepID=A0A814FT18_9BILA|nr:unnamed protein product [Adineta steineri]CAF4215330.1 unnamed protein product [Adineta steineri]